MASNPVTSVSATSTNSFVSRSMGIMDAFPFCGPRVWCPSVGPVVGEIEASLQDVDGHIEEVALGQERMATHPGHGRAMASTKGILSATITMPWPW